MVIDEKIARLIFEMEYEIGSECYNPNSLNGYTGEEGCEFRYPVHIHKSIEDEMWKFRGKVYGCVSDDIYTMKYKFGSNHLFIGNGLVNALNMLENRYGIDFNELEEELDE